MTQEPKTSKPRGRKGGGRNGLAVTLYLPQCWSDFAKLCREKLGISGSARISQHIVHDVAEFHGKSFTDSEALAEQIESLEAQVSAIILKGSKLTRFLDAKGVYHDLETLASELNLDFESFKNVKPVIVNLLRHKLGPDDKFTKDDIEIFLQVIGLAVEKSKLKAELDKLRLQTNSDEEVSPELPDKVSEPKVKESEELVKLDESEADEEYSDLE